MASSSSKFQTYIFSAAGVGMMAAAIIAINIIASQFHVRKDFTEDKLYTLSEGSKQILSRLKSPVTIRYFRSHGRNDMPVYLKNYAKRIEDLLSEYVIAGNGKIKIEKFNPEPDSDAEDAASLDGIDGQLIATGEKIYLGLSVTSIDVTMSIPFLSPNNENTLEYDITRLIYRVTSSGDMTIGVMSGLPVFGTPDMPPGMPPGMMKKRR